MLFGWNERLIWASDLLAICLEGEGGREREREGGEKGESVQGVREERWTESCLKGIVPPKLNKTEGKNCSQYTRSLTSKQT